MYDFSLLPDDSLLALFIALVLFSVAFVSFSIVAVYTLIKTTIYSKKHKDKLRLICDVAYFHERGKRENQDANINNAVRYSHFIPPFSLYITDG